jgi:LPS-assembly protein
MDLIPMPRPPYKRIGFIFYRKCLSASPFRLWGYISTLLIFGYITIYSSTTTPAFAAQSEIFKDDPSIPWHITADEVSHDTKNDQYTASGNVIIQKKDRKLTADSVRFDHKTMQALATGNIVMTVGEDILSGSKIELDLNSETGTLYNGTLFLKENHFYIKGDKIHKVGKNTDTAESATISSCDGEHPDWKITGRNLDVTIEGYGSVKHAAVWAKKVPVFYTPYLFFPAKFKR